MLVFFNIRKFVIYTLGFPDETEKAEATTSQYQDAMNQASPILLKNQTDINRQFKVTSQLFPSQRSENVALPPEMSVNDSVRDNLLSQDIVSKKSKNFCSSQESVISSEEKTGSETPKTHTRKSYHKDNCTKRESFTKKEKIRINTFIKNRETNRQNARRRNVQKTKENNKEHHTKVTVEKNSKIRHGLSAEQALKEPTVIAGSHTLNNDSLNSSILPDILPNNLISPIATGFLNCIPSKRPMEIIDLTNSPTKSFSETTLSVTMDACETNIGVSSELNNEKINKGESMISTEPFLSPVFDCQKKGIQVSTITQNPRVIKRLTVKEYQARVITTDSNNSNMSSCNQEAPKLQPLKNQNFRGNKNEKESRLPHVSVITSSSIQKLNGFQNTGPGEKKSIQDIHSWLLGVKGSADSKLSTLFISKDDSRTDIKPLTEFGSSNLEMSSKLLHSKILKEKMPGKLSCKNERNVKYLKQRKNSGEHQKVSGKIKELPCKRPMKRKYEEKNCVNWKRKSSLDEWLEKNGSERKFIPSHNVLVDMGVSKSQDAQKRYNLTNCSESIMQSCDQIASGTFDTKLSTTLTPKAFPCLSSVMPNIASNSHCKFPGITPPAKLPEPNIKRTIVPVPPQPFITNSPGRNITIPRNCTTINLDKNGGNQCSEKLVTLKPLPSPFSKSKRNSTLNIIDQKSQLKETALVGSNCFYTSSNNYNITSPKFSIESNDTK